MPKGREGDTEERCVKFLCRGEWSDLGVKRRFALQFREENRVEKK